MSEFTRVDRLRKQIQDVIAEIIQRRVKDPHIGMVTITDVELTGDLREAKVYYSTLGDETTQRATNKALKKALGFIQTQLAHELRIRKAPLIEFKVDKTAERAGRIEELLEQIHQEDERRSESD
jgi:ribosome-binding factor A